MSAVKHLLICTAVWNWYGSGIVVQSSGSRAESVEPGAVKQRTRPRSLISWRTNPNYTADTVSSLQSRAGHSAAGRHACAGSGVVVCSRFRKSPADTICCLHFCCVQCLVVVSFLCGNVLRPFFILCHLPFTFWFILWFLF